MRNFCIIIIISSFLYYAIFTYTISITGLGSSVSINILGLQILGLIIISKTYTYSPSG